MRVANTTVGQAGAVTASSSMLRWAGLVAALLVLGGGAALLNLTQGTPRLDVGEALRLAVDGVDTDRAAFVVRDLRLPRIMVAVLVGAMLGLTGTLMQDTLRNPMAGPEFLGVASGSSLLVAFVILFPVGLAPVWRPFVALAAGLAASAVVLTAMRVTRDPVRVLLVGAALTALLNAATVGLIALAPDPMIAAAVYRYLTGTLSASSWGDVRMVLPWFAVAVPLALATGRTLNLLQLGDDLATGLGTNVLRTRLLLFALAVALLAPGIAVAGPIAFVALLAPHLARRALATTDARQVLPAAALGGAATLLVSDALGRLLLRPVEIPAGVWTILVGGPFLLALLRGSLRRRGRSA